MAIEIVDLPIENGGSFHSYVKVYQRVSMVATPRLLLQRTLPRLG